MFQVEFQPKGGLRAPPLLGRPLPAGLRHEDRLLQERARRGAHHRGWRVLREPGAAAERGGGRHAGHARPAQPDDARQGGQEELLHRRVDHVMCRDVA